MNIGALRWKTINQKNENYFVKMPKETVKFKTKMFAACIKTLIYHLPSLLSMCSIKGFTFQLIALLICSVLNVLFCKTIFQEEITISQQVNKEYLQKCSTLFKMKSFHVQMRITSIVQLFQFSRKNQSGMNPTHNVASIYILYVSVLYLVKTKHIQFTISC